ncbi:hypothetical protein [Anaerosinus massiliensis]|uniref:hypothetical protein n=1 Tax=Massilibacillus massiliensis TaxID=1806837 RepID=UPI000B01C2B2|nr:hypothetical protein [Massilibacillus massiliensis]
MKLFLLICAFIFIGLVELPPLLKKKQRGELIAFLVLFFIGFTLNLLYVLDVNVPNPNKGIEYLIKLMY